MTVAKSWGDKHSTVTPLMHLARRMYAALQKGHLISVKVAQAPRNLLL